MSDPTGPQTAPQKPSFASEVIPSGYGPTRLVVTSPDGKTIHEADLRPSTYASKGSTPGSFVPKDVKSGKPVPTFTAIPNVGKFEVRNPETEELIRRGRLAKQEGIDFDTDSDGKVTGVHIPEEWAGEEPELRKQLKAKEEQENKLSQEKETLVEAIPLSVEFASLASEAEVYRPKLTNPSTIAILEQVSDELAKLFAEIQGTPSKDTLGKIKEFLSDFRHAVKNAKSEVAKTHAPTPAPTSTPVPLATQAPKPPEPLHEYGGWPESIISYQKARKDRNGNRPAGWYSIQTGNRLNEQEGWGLEYDAFKIVYKKYLELLRSIPAADRRMAKPLIEAKNAVLGAVKKEDLSLVEALRASLEEAIDEWKSRWEDIKKVKELESKLNKAMKVVNKFPEDKKKRVSIDSQKAVSLVQGLLQKLAGGDFDEEEYEKLVKEVGKYVERVQNVEKGVAFTTDELVNGIFQTDKDGNKKLLGVVRDIPQKVADLSESEKQKKIKPVGRPEMTMGAYVAEQEAKRTEGSKILITDEIEDRLPELKVAGYPVGQKIEEGVFKKIETRAMYERQFTRDQNDFLRRYTTPVLDEKNNVVRYVESPLLKSQQRSYTNDKGREIYGIYETIKDILEAHDIVVERQNEEERKVEEQKKSEQREHAQSKNRITFHPDLHKRNWFGKKLKDQYVTDYHAAPNMVRENILGSKARYEDLKRKREKYLSDPVNSHFTEDEQKLDEKMDKALKEHENGKKNVLFRDVGNIVADNESRFRSAVNNYERKVEPLVEAKIEDRKLPTDPEKRQKRLEALKKIEDILNTREQNLAKNKKLQAQKNRMWARMAVPVIAGSLLFGVAKYLEGPEVVQKTEEPTPIAKTVEQSWRDIVNDKDLLARMERGAPEDMDIVRNIIMEKLPGLVDPKNPASIDAILEMDGFSVLRQPGYLGLTETQQTQLSQFIINVQDISQKINYDERLSALRSGGRFDHPSDWFTTPRITVKEYMTQIRKKLKNIY
jgi:hypothetical protein